MSIFVFLGPTLARAEAQRVCAARYLAPVAQGDVYRAARSRPRAIGIIDGYFEGVPSVWHKEILWAMEQGVQMFGAASMGALRAAELNVFGMRGVGRIFEAFRDGVLEDDDEVAVIHGPAEVDFAPLSEPMVNIRATLERAADDGVISAAAQAAISDLAKQLHYPCRDWETVLAQAAGSTLVASAAVESLRVWLPDGRVDRKREDALALLAELRELSETDAAPSQVAYTVERTEAWDRLTEGGTRADDGGEGGTISRSRVLDELRLQGNAYDEVRRAALLRTLGLRDSNRRRSPLAPGALRDALRAFREQRGLYTRTDLVRWCRDADMDGADLDRLIEEEAQIADVAARAELTEQMIDTLRLNGAYRRLRVRAAEKQATLRARGHSDPGPGDLSQPPAMLVAWFFEEQLGRPLPDDLDAALRELGLEDREALYRLIARERLYSEYIKNS